MLAFGSLQIWFIGPNDSRPVNNFSQHFRDAEVASFWLVTGICLLFVVAVCSTIHMQINTDSRTKCVMRRITRHYFVAMFNLMRSVNYLWWITIFNFEFAHLYIRFFSLFILRVLSSIHVITHKQVQFSHCYSFFSIYLLSLYSLFGVKMFNIHIK